MNLANIAGFSPLRATTLKLTIHSVDQCYITDLFISGYKDAESKSKMIGLAAWKDGFPDLKIIVVILQSDIDYMKRCVL